MTPPVPLFAEQRGGIKGGEFVYKNKKRNYDLS
jgi:hypothetical protein